MDCTFEIPIQPNPVRNNRRSDERRAKRGDAAAVEKEPGRETEGAASLLLQNDGSTNNMNFFLLLAKLGGLGLFGKRGVRLCDDFNLPKQNSLENVKKLLFLLE